MHSDAIIHDVGRTPFQRETYALDGFDLVNLALVFFEEDALQVGSGFFGQPKIACVGANADFGWTRVSRNEFGGREFKVTGNGFDFVSRNSHIAFAAAAIAALGANEWCCLLAG